MATLEQCRAAVEELSRRMSGSDHKPGLADRTLSCHIPDLDVTFSGTLRDGTLADITTEPQSSKAQIRVTTSSDDLVAMVDGELDMGKAWLTKRLKIDASMLDLIKMKGMF